MASDLSYGFPPVSGPDAEILILGSLPSRRSIAAGEYYGHPRNAFWPIMGELIATAGTYPARCKRLIEARIALWDVLSASERPGSLDADIRRETAVPNDFASFLKGHPRIGRIGFNGGAAHRLFAQRVAPSIELAGYRLVRLPSTSPAHARMDFDAKLAHWREFLRGSSRLPDSEAK